jgi:DNA-binding CsgD family transcriptional regulator
MPKTAFQQSFWHRDNPALLLQRPAPIHDDNGGVEPFPNLDELSLQERRIVALFSLDYSTKEAARELGISPDTVKTYVRRIYAKLGVKSKAGCVAVAFHRLMEHR